MAVEIKNFTEPDESRPFEGKGGTDVVVLMGRPVGRGTFRPGWRWSENVKPIAGTETCEVAHFGYCLAGRMRIVMNDGSQHEIAAGDVMAIPPGHDAEVLGNEDCVLVDFGDIEKYAKR